MRHRTVSTLTAMWECIFEPYPRRYAGQIKYISSAGSYFERNHDAYNDPIVQRRLIKAILIHESIPVVGVQGLLSAKPNLDDTQQIKIIKRLTHHTLGINGFKELKQLTPFFSSELAVKAIVDYLFKMGNMKWDPPTPFHEILLTLAELSKRSPSIAEDDKFCPLIFKAIQTIYSKEVTEKQSVLGVVVAHLDGLAYLFYAKENRWALPFLAEMPSEFFKPEDRKPFLEFISGQIKHPKSILAIALSKQPLTQYPEDLQSILIAKLPTSFNGSQRH